MIHFIHRLFKLEGIIHRFFFWLIIMIVLTSTTFLFTYSAVEKRQRIEETKASLHYDLLNQEMVLKSWTEDREQEVYLLASFPVSKDGDYNIMAARFRYYNEYYEQIESVIYIDSDGYVRIHTGEDEAILYDSLINVKDEEFFQIAKKGEKQLYHIVDDTFKEDRHAILFASPVITYDGEFNGVVATIVYPDKIIELLRQTIRGETGKITVINGDGTKILDVTKDSKRLYLFEKDKSKLDGKLLHHLRKQENGFIEYINNEGEKIYSSFTSLSNNKYFLLNEVTKREVLQPHNRMVALLSVITFVIIVLGFLIFIPISQKLIQPFKYLLDGISRMKDGEYTIQLNPEKFKKSPIELRQMMNVFNEMAISIDEKKRLLKRLSNTDGLTGVANRRLFELKLTEQWEICNVKHKPISLLFIDIDYFKQYNDRFGHLEGDACLKKVARAIDHLITDPNQLVARYGGEEFVIVLPNTNSNGAYDVAKQVQNEVEKLRIQHSENSGEQYVTVSIGVATMNPTDANNKEDLIQLADQAVYEAKSQGRNRIIVK